MPVSPGASGMQPRDPFRPWRGTLASGQGDGEGQRSLVSCSPWGHEEAKSGTRLSD